jgi:cell pole-organizing protein PopZ
MFEPHDATLPPLPPTGLRGSLADGDGVHLRAVPNVEPPEASISPVPSMKRGPRPAASQARPPFGQGKAGIRPFATTPEAPAMVSRETASEALQSFQKLTDEILGGADGGGRLDELARELLRPMLKQWLDQNLSGIVEVLVRDEIERVSRRTRR